MEQAPQGEGWGSGDLPAESFFTHGSFFYGSRTYTTSQQQVWAHIHPTRHPDPDEAGEVGFLGPVSATTAAAYGSHGPGQGKRGRVGETAVLRLLREVEATSTPGADDCCAICLEDFDAAPAPLTLRAMPGCCHAFHQHGILQWLRLKAACPVCRHHLPVSLSTEEGEEDQEEQRRRRSVYDGWLSFRGHCNESINTVFQSWFRLEAAGRDGRRGDGHG